MSVEKDACGVGLVYSPRFSHDVLQKALEALSNLEHRGAVGADGESGDGAGVMTAIPWELLESEGWCIKKNGSRQSIPNAVRAVGMIFLPRNHEEFCKRITEHFLKEQGLLPLGWRSTPVNLAALGPAARQTVPTIEQILISAPAELCEKELEKKLHAARRCMTNYLWSQPFSTEYFVVSMSCKTIVYKAMVRSQVLPHFYGDLNDPGFKTNFAMFHRRFSTNTNPKWWLAQPFRFVGHNGEINTLAGNRIWAQARAGIFEQAQLTSRNEPVLHPEGSDSANLDNMLELLLSAGQSPQHAFMSLVPEARSESCSVDNMDPVAAFFEFNAALQEPWDGPALIVFCDGHSLGAILDRNGLRPARYARLKDGSLILCSEVGAIEVKPELIVERGRLGPGQMISVDLNSGQISSDREIKEKIASQQPYAQWLQEVRINFSAGHYLQKKVIDEFELLQEQIAAGFGREDLDHLAYMAEQASEPVWSMGDDSALPVLSNQPRVLFDHFRQRFAQVTNPPIDSMRERLVMSIATYLGSRKRMLNPTPDCADVIRCTSPLLTEMDLKLIGRLEDRFAQATISIASDGHDFDLETELNRICDEAVAAALKGAVLIILSDRRKHVGQIAVPVLAAVGAVHHYLISAGLRLDCSIIVETSQCWSPHHIACLLSFGAQAVCPYTAWETIRQISINKSHSTKNNSLADAVQAQENYRKAIENSLLKVMAKMGVSVLSSYIGAQLMECVGLSQEIISRCFAGTVSHLGGMTFADIAADMMRFNQAANTSNQIIDYGHFRYREKGEFHGNNPELVKTLHKAVGLKDEMRSEDERLEIFRAYSQQIAARPPAAVRDLLSFKSDRQPISIESVEPAASIVRRFCTGGMSLGALSPEMHETLAVAMNRLGGKSNSGEGGEDQRRYRAVASGTIEGRNGLFPGLKGLRDGDHSGSAIRQVASGRFGVTAEYLATAQQIEIKIAQGAKPGEGGQLPGDKVSEFIGNLRRAKAGTTLISPPPHHDIYSIEDLAQLIYDLRQVNRKAMISVKLVSSSGIGTIAAGVAKANADIIQISGHEGGTGASPVSSIKHAGLPWEIGLVEAHHALLANNLRQRVLLRVDGGLRAGFDVVVAALLGAEEYGFGSLVLLAAGCIMARVCHTNNCPVGVASQKPTLRNKFPGKPEQIEQLLLFIAEEVRHILAELGYRSVHEIIGRSDLLQYRSNVSISKSATLNLGEILTQASDDNRSWLQGKHEPHANPPMLDDIILQDGDINHAIHNHAFAKKEYKICNRDRATGSRIAGTIAEKYGDTGFKGQLSLKFNGIAGQSFGAFNVAGLRLILNGEANDYVGKGMNGGTIAISYPQNQFNDGDVLAGNACLYGATGGALYCAGRVGERFAVRNAGAFAVIEGAGNHCCEYMTGGAVVVLGQTGSNFGAGMTGGVAYVLDEHRAFEQKLNRSQNLRCQSVINESALKRLITRHLKLTGSSKARKILENWNEYLPLFRQVAAESSGDTQAINVQVQAQEKT